MIFPIEVNARGKKWGRAVLALRILVIPLVLLVLTGFGRSACAQQKKSAADSPVAVIKSLYTAHKDGKGPLFTKSGKNHLAKYFDSKLSQLIWKNVSETPEDSVGNLDFDPLYNAQDVKITHFKVGEPKIKGRQALSIVSFNNYEAKTRITFSLLKTSAGWRIQNLDYGGGSDLVKLLSQPIR